MTSLHPEIIKISNTIRKFITDHPREKINMLDKLQMIIFSETIETDLEYQKQMQQENIKHESYN